jgi:hypothetical protein
MAKIMNPIDLMLFAALVASGGYILSDAFHMQPRCVVTCLGKGSDRRDRDLAIEPSADTAVNTSIARKSGRPLVTAAEFFRPFCLSVESFDGIRSA